MTNLNLHDLKPLTEDRLGLMLSNEKREMLGEQKIPAIQKVDKGLA
jgi:hypothetical protein